MSFALTYVAKFYPIVIDTNKLGINLFYMWFFLCKHFSLTRFLNILLFNKSRYTISYKFLHFNKTHQNLKQTHYLKF